MKWFLNYELKNMQGWNEYRIMNSRTCEDQPIELCYELWLKILKNENRYCKSCRDDGLGYLWRNLKC